jgi:cell division protein FtsN
MPAGILRVQESGMAGAGNGNAKNGSRDNGGSKGGKRFNISLSLPGMVVVVTVLLFGLAWTFVIGVLVGRGYKPEAAVPEIAALMPGTGNASKGEVQVLKPEDLQYLDDLTKKPAAPPASLVAKAPEKPADKPADKPTDKTTDKTKPAEKPTDKPADKAATKSPDSLAEKLADKLTGQTGASAQPATASPAAPLDADASGQVYRYVYQVAAFPDPASAQTYKAKLEGIGLKGGLEKTVDGSGRTWHRVLVNFTGTPEDTRGLKDKLAGIGISRVILRDKKPR